MEVETVNVIQECTLSGNIKENKRPTFLQLLKIQQFQRDFTDRLLTCRSPNQDRKIRARYLRFPKNSHIRTLPIHSIPFRLVDVFKIMKISKKPFNITDVMSHDTILCSNLQKNFTDHSMKSSVRQVNKSESTFNTCFPPWILISNHFKIPNLRLKC